MVTRLFCVCLEHFSHTCFICNNIFQYTLFNSKNIQRIHIWIMEEKMEINVENKCSSRKNELQVKWWMKNDKSKQIQDAMMLVIYFKAMNKQHFLVSKFIMEIMQFFACGLTSNEANCIFHIPINQFIDWTRNKNANFNWLQIYRIRIWIDLFPVWRR